MQNTPFSTNKTLNLNGRLIDLSIPRVMGVLNVTPDSFYEGSRVLTEETILRQADKMLAEGADFIDVGGYSSRPGAADVSLEEEMERVLRAITVIRRQYSETLISVDTFRSAVAEAAVNAGAVIVNDISGGNLDPEMHATVARLRVPYILMHMKGDPRTMSSQAQYDDLLKEILDYFHQKIHALEQLDVSDIIVDPGFGFSKTAAQNFTLLHHLDQFSILGRPMLAGLSRKSMIWRTLDTVPEAALNGTTALNMVALLKGANILRVHDVREAREVVKLFTSLEQNVRQ